MVATNLELGLGIGVGTFRVVLNNFEAGVEELQSFEYACGAHFSQFGTLNLHKVTCKAVLVALAYTGYHHLVELKAWFQLNHKIVFGVQYLFRLWLVTHEGNPDGLLLAHTQVELSVYIGDTARKAFARAVGNHNHGTHKLLACFVVYYGTLHAHLLFGGVLLFVWLDDYFAVILETYLHILVSDKLAYDLVERFVLYGNAYGLVNVHKCNPLQCYLGVGCLGRLFQNLTQWLVTYSQGYRLLLPIAGILRMHISAQAQSH